jgi:hypothetical protein
MLHRRTAILAKCGIHDQRPLFVVMHCGSDDAEEMAHLVDRLTALKVAKVKKPDM